MNYDLTAAGTPPFLPGLSDDLDKKIAFHRAGHAVAICLGNKQRNMPEVYFQVTLGFVEGGTDSAGTPFECKKRLVPMVEGGRLIQSLPFSFAEATQYYTPQQYEEYFKAFETDIINLLAGPIAEAKYVAYQDDEIFNRNLINLHSLKFYGGAEELDTISEYMACFIPEKDKREKKLAELYSAAFRFVDKRSNWQAIKLIADMILSGAKDIINCEDIAAWLKCNQALG